VVDAEYRRAYERAASEPYGDDVWERLTAATVDARNGDDDALRHLGLALHRAAFCCPDATAAIYDTWTAAWLTQPRADLADFQTATAALCRPPAIPTGLWPALWQIVDAPADASLTERVAALGPLIDEARRGAFAQAQASYPGQAELAEEAPRRLVLADLEGHPQDSLGDLFHSLIVDNGFDLDVIDPDLVMGYHPQLDVTNAHILQQHEIWHLVAGYSTSPLHEIAISGFQLAQFGQLYSAMFLATIALKLSIDNPLHARGALHVTAEAFAHGRQTRPMMNIPWRDELGSSLESIRDRYGIATFESLIPDTQAPA